MSLQPDQPGYAAERQFCKAWVTVKTTEESIKEKIRKALDLIKHPWKILGALLAAIADMAAGMAATVVAQAGAIAAAAVAKLLEKIFALMLEVLLAGPEALMAIMALPLRKAKNLAKAEITALGQAQTDVDAIFAIMNKWLGGFGGEQYIDKMNRAIPFLNDAIQILGRMRDDVNTGGGNSAFFDENKYSKVLGDISQVLEITRPAPTILNLIGAEKGGDYDLALQMENNKKKRIAENSAKTQRWYNGEKDRFDKKRSDAIAAAYAKYPSDRSTVISISTPVLKNGLSNYADSKARDALIVSADAIYFADMEQLDGKKALRDTEDVSEAGVWAAAFSPLNSNNLKKTASALGQDISLSFQSDASLLGEHLLSLGQSIATAYSSNKSCQLFTNAAYKSRDKLQALLEWFIWVAKKSGNGSALIAEGAFISSSKLLTITKDMYQTEVDKYLKNEGNAFTQAGKLSAGYAITSSASSVLSAMIVQSLIDTINLDENLTDGMKAEFEALNANIEAIPDWDGRLNVWGVDLTKSSLTPYLKLTSDIIGATASLPFNLASSSSDGKANNISNMADISGGIIKLQNHAGFVYSSLAQFNVRVDPRLEKIMKLIDSLGSIVSDAFMLLAMFDMVKGLLVSLTGAGNVDCSEEIDALKNSDNEADQIMGAKLRLAGLRTGMYANLKRDSENENDAIQKAEDEISALVAKSKSKPATQNDKISGLTTQTSTYAGAVDIMKAMGMPK